MAEENDEPQVEEEVEESEGSSGGGKLVLIIGLVNTLGLIGLAYMAMTGAFGGGGSGTTLSPEAMGESSLQSDKKGGGQDRPSTAPGPKVELGELVVNLKEPTGDRFLKIKVELELDSEETRPEVEGRLNAIRYQLNLLLSGQRVVDVQGPDAIETLRKAMIRRANSRLAKGRIVNVWPGEWIVQ
jgi:flagellar basal body-associated protein FliL